MLSYGDSKTDRRGFQATLEGLLAAAGHPMPVLTVARSGATVASALTASAADFGSDVRRPRGPIKYVLFNLGVNDISTGLPAEATWEANVVSIITAMQAEWPSVKIVFMLPWYRDGGEGNNTVATRLGHIVSGRESWVSIGPDERVWLEGGDDGATMTSDGVHYSAAGNAEAAAQWLAKIAALGY